MGRLYASNEVLLPMLNGVELLQSLAYACASNSEQNKLSRESHYYLLLQTPQPTPLPNWHNQQAPRPARTMAATNHTYLRFNWCRL